VTARIRAGLELKASGFSLLAEGESTIPLVDDYNDTLPGNGVEPFPIVADPGNVELNRLQVGYMKNGTGFTLGRQRIVLDNARFVGNVGWRDNEQTYDAVRGQAKFGIVTLDASYSISQRTVFGYDSPNEHFDGDFVFLNGGVDTRHVDGKAFAYLIDYDTRLAFSSQTYGALVTGDFPIPGFGKLTALASYAAQGDYGDNPVALRRRLHQCAARARLLELHADGGLRGTRQRPRSRGVPDADGDAARVQRLGRPVPDHSRAGAARLLRRDLEDLQARGAARAQVRPDLSRVRQRLRRIDYGSEWDASVGFKLGPVALLAKYASYDASGFAVDTDKVWLQGELAF
jgi:hypothetical protein